MLCNLILNTFCIYRLTQGNRIPELAGRYSGIDFSTLSFPPVKEHFRKVGIPEDSKCILFLDICDACCREFELRSGNIPSSNCDAPDTSYGQGVTQNVGCYCRWDLLSQTCESLRNTKTHLHYQKCSFQRCLCMEFREGKNCSSSQEERGQLFDC